MVDIEGFEELQKQKAREIVLNRLLDEVKKVEEKKGYIFFKEQEDIRK